MSRRRRSARALLLGALAAAPPACRAPGSSDETLKPADGPAEQGAERSMENRIGKDEALEIARRDARLAYGDLAPYEVSIDLREGNWQVDYALRDREAQGGGPHYVISAETGEILSKRYEQ